MAGENNPQSSDVNGHSSLKERDWQRLPFHNPDQLRYSLTDAERKKHRAYAVRSQSPPVSLFVVLH